MDNTQTLNIEVADFKTVIGEIPKGELPVIAIYNSPSDIPDKYVARLWSTGSAGPNPTRYIAAKETLNDIRKTIPGGMFRIDRCAADDSVIVETWL